MYAIIKTGGKQYRVAAGDTIKVETLNAEVGSQVTLSEVLAVSDGNELKVGAPFVEGASVTATVVSRPSRQGSHLQDASSQALHQERWSSSKLHGAQDRLDRGLIWTFLRE